MSKYYMIVEKDDGFYISIRALQTKINLPNEYYTCESFIESLKRKGVKTITVDSETLWCMSEVYKSFAICPSDEDLRMMK